MGAEQISIVRDSAYQLAMTRKFSGEAFREGLHGAYFLVLCDIKRSVYFLRSMPKGRKDIQASLWIFRLF